MTQQEMDLILERQKEFFHTGATLSVAFRQQMLDKLYQTVQAYQQQLTDALTADLGKSEFEGFMCEVGMALTEISYMRKHVAKFARPHRVKTPLAQFAASSFRQSVPYGNTLIMSPWNYPVLLTLDPLATAIAAGNTVILKPSAYSPATSAVLEKMIGETFPSEYVAVVTGGRAENAHLLEQKFDFIFFTGSTSVGREVLRHAAEHLTPAVLELGGKSPCIVDETAKLPLAAKRIVWGKFLNCGQTCVAPDYILCHAAVKDRLLEEIRKQMTAQFGAKPLDNPNYGKIITPKHFQRVTGLIDPAKVVVGGTWDADTCRIEPTVMDGVDWTDPVMGEEIFGPVLPILTYEKYEDLFGLLQDRPKPLAFYFFSEHKARQKEVVARLPFGGGCINDVIIHLATSEMPFGGVGESGMGSYHGKAGFDAFSHSKSVVDKKTWMDLPMRYQPFQGFYRKLLGIFLR